MNKAEKTECRKSKQFHTLMTGKTKWAPIWITETQHNNETKRMKRNNRTSIQLNCRFNDYLGK